MIVSPAEDALAPRNVLPSTLWDPFVKCGGALERILWVAARCCSLFFWSAWPVSKTNVFLSPVEATFPTLLQGGFCSGVCVCSLRPLCGYHHALVPVALGLDKTSVSQTRTACVVFGCLDMYTYVFVFLFHTHSSRQAPTDRVVFLLPTPHMAGHVWSMGAWIQLGSFLPSPPWLG